MMTSRRETLHFDHPYLSREPLSDCHVCQKTAVLMMMMDSWERKHLSALESIGASNSRCRPSCLPMHMTASIERRKSTYVGFEPTRGDPIGLAGRRFDHSAKVSMPCQENLRILERSKLHELLVQATAHGFKPHG